MRLINDRSEVSTVAQQWREQYYINGKWQSCQGDSKDIYERLAALNISTANASDVAEIIGNTSWCGPFNCDECTSIETVLVEFHDTKVCARCLRKAIRMIRLPSKSAESNGGQKP